MSSTTSPPAATNAKPFLKADLNATPRDRERSELFTRIFFNKCGILELALGSIHVLPQFRTYRAAIAAEVPRLLSADTVRLDINQSAVSGAAGQGRRNAD